MFRESDSRGIELTHLECMGDAEKFLASHTIDIILLDLGLRDAQGMEAVRRAQVVAPRIPLVVLTGLDDESAAAQALQEGAQDYLIKGQIETRGLLRALRYAVERKTMEEELFGEREQARFTLNCIGDAVASTDVSGKITFLNVVAEKMTGWSRQGAVGRPMGEVLRILDATTRETIPNPMQKAVGQDRARIGRGALAGPVVEHAQTAQPGEQARVQVEPGLQVVVVAARRGQQRRPRGPHRLDPVQ